MIGISLRGLSGYLGIEYHILEWKEVEVLFYGNGVGTAGQSSLSTSHRGLLMLG